MRGRRLDTTEIWHLKTDFSHPLHLHLVHFQVLSHSGRPGLYDAGWKDTVDLGPGQAASILVRFGGYRGRYVFHCHNLEHEDMSMMGELRGHLMFRYVMLAAILGLLAILTGAVVTSSEIASGQGANPRSSQGHWDRGDRPGFRSSHPGFLREGDPAPARGGMERIRCGGHQCHDRMEGGSAFADVHGLACLRGTSFYGMHGSSPRDGLACMETCS